MKETVQKQKEDYGGQSQKLGIKKSASRSIRLDIVRVIKPGLKQVGVLIRFARWLTSDIELPIDYYSDNHIANYRPNFPKKLTL